MLPFVRSFCAFAALTFDQNPRPVSAPTPAPITAYRPSDAELDALADEAELRSIATTEPGWVAAERQAAEEVESIACIMRRRQIVRTRLDAQRDLDEVRSQVLPPPPAEAMGDIIDTLAVTSLYVGDVVLVGNAKGVGVHEEKVVDVQRLNSKKVVVLTDKGAFEALATARVYLAKTVSSYHSWGTSRDTAWTPTSKMVERANESTPRSTADVARGDELAKLIAEQDADARTASRRRAFTRLPADPMESFEGLVLACEDFLGEFTAIGHVRPTEEPEAPKAVGPVRWLGSKQRALDLA